LTLQVKIVCGVQVTVTFDSFKRFIHSKMLMHPLMRQVKTMSESLNHSIKPFNNLCLKPINCDSQLSRIVLL